MLKNSSSSGYSGGMTRPLSRVRRAGILLAIVALALSMIWLTADSRWAFALLVAMPIAAWWTPGKEWELTRPRSLWSGTTWVPLMAATVPPLYVFLRNGDIQMARSDVIEGTTCQRVQDVWQWHSIVLLVAVMGLCAGARVLFRQYGELVAPGAMRLRTSYRWRNLPAQSMVDHLLTAGGTWLALVSLVGLFSAIAISPLRVTCNCPFWGDAEKHVLASCSAALARCPTPSADGWRSAVPCPSLIDYRHVARLSGSVAGLVSSLGLAIYGLRRARARRAWLVRVASGTVQGWSIREIDLELNALPDSTRVIDDVSDVDEQMIGLLYREAVVPSGAYRMHESTTELVGIVPKRKLLLGSNQTLGQAWGRRIVVAFVIVPIVAAAVVCAGMAVFYRGAGV